MNISDKGKAICEAALNGEAFKQFTKELQLCLGGFLERSEEQGEEVADVHVLLMIMAMMDIMITEVEVPEDVLRHMVGDAISTATCAQKHFRDEEKLH